MRTINQKIIGWKRLGEIGIYFLRMRMTVSTNFVFLEQNLNRGQVHAKHRNIGYYIMFSRSLNFRAERLLQVPSLTPLFRGEMNLHTFSYFSYAQLTSAKLLTEDKRVWHK